MASPISRWEHEHILEAVQTPRAERRLSAASRAEYAAGEVLIATRPTTLTGAALALIAHAIKHREVLMPDGDDPYILLRSIADTLGAHAPDEIARSWA